MQHRTMSVEQRLHKAERSILEATEEAYEAMVVSNETIVGNALVNAAATSDGDNRAGLDVGLALFGTSDAYKSQMEEEFREKLSTVEKDLDLIRCGLTAVDDSLDSDDNRAPDASTDVDDSGGDGGYSLQQILHVQNHLVYRRQYFLAFVVLVLIFSSSSVYAFVLLPSRSCWLHPTTQLTSQCKYALLSPDIIERARVPLFWESQQTEDSKPVLNLSARDSGSLSLSDDADVNSSGLCVRESDVDLNLNNSWEDGTVWEQTELYLVSKGIIFDSDSSSSNSTKLTSTFVISNAPQLVRLPTSQVIASAEFFLNSVLPQSLPLAMLLQYDPSLLTYHADDLGYGVEYLANMCTRGNQTVALEVIHSQCSFSPQLALNMFRLGVDGGIDERRISRALKSAATASSKAVEVTVGDWGRSYREMKQLKGK
eukprot:scaffold4948_cov208-Alexandrium_tamarense.AAC.1